MAKQTRAAAGLRFGIVVARFNQRITGKLLRACTDTLAQCGVAPNDIQVVRVPGAFEIPLVARTMARANRFDAVICLGAVIRGDTPHFDYICEEVSRGIGQAALETEVPIIFGVLTTETVAQAEARADQTQFNRGGAAAESAIEMVKVMRRIRGEADNVTGSNLTSQNGQARLRRTR
ncbi:MAG: 6,7-dimethyl-8-ribityllumazine synthase [Nitrospira sp.]|nr:6,7-dimethyl-8-ribityllumazine synthase [Nitrospira sp.]MDH4303732.1 6,7-dimethyl-8-ribityllumazine synthase [Nitrospira sp.]MDH5192376.1 6,7-dimethyl-8-ribityllumazine synthase [Nitrospira sp.]